MSIRQDHDRPLSIALVSVHGDPLLPLGSEEAGGQNVYVREVAKAMAVRGHQVDVFTRGRECTGPEILIQEGFRVIRLPSGPRGFISRNHLFEHLPEFVERLGYLVGLDACRYDLVHSNYWLSGWVGRRLAERWRVPQVHTHHSMGAVKFAAEGRLPAHGQRRLRVERSVIAEAGMVATSNQELALMRQHYGHVPRFRIIPCGIDDAIFYPRERRTARRLLGLDEAAPLLAYAGRFDPNKGIDTLVEALAELNRQAPVHLVLAGGSDPLTKDGIEFQRIQALVAERGLLERVTFLGKVKPERLANVYSAADLCVVPSHYEAFGLVAIESMGCGTPVVASNVGGLPFTVKEGVTGHLVPPQDPAALARACARLLSAPSERERMGRAGSRLVHEAFTWNAVAAQLEDFYRHQLANVLANERALAQ